MFRNEDLLDRLYDQPFRPFRIHLSDGDTIEVPLAGMVMVGRTTAVLPKRFSIDEEGRPIAESWRTISLPHIVQLSGIDEPRNGRRRRRK